MTTYRIESLRKKAYQRVVGIVKKELTTNLRVAKSEMINWPYSGVRLNEESIRILFGRRKYVTTEQILLSSVEPELKSWLVLRIEMIEVFDLHRIALSVADQIARPIWEKHRPGDCRIAAVIYAKNEWLNDRMCDDELRATIEAAESAARYARNHLSSAARCAVCAACIDSVRKAGLGVPKRAGARAANDAVYHAICAQVDEWDLA